MPGPSGLDAASRARKIRRRAQQREESLRIVREVLQTTPVPAEQQRLWAEMTGGASVPSFYRWRTEALNEGGA